MMTARLGILASTVVICSLTMVCSSQAQSGKTQAQQLVDSMVKKIADVSGLEISATLPARPPA